MNRIADVLAVLGDRWTLLVVREVALGRRRFRRDPGRHRRARAVLSDRLRRLTDAGVLATRSYQVPGSRARNEYTPTPAGLDLLPVLAALTDWGDRHLAVGGERADVLYRHTGCGGRVRAELRCECGQLVGPTAGLIAEVHS